MYLTVNDLTSREILIRNRQWYEIEKWKKAQEATRRTRTIGLQLKFA